MTGGPRADSRIRLALIHILTVLVLVIGVSGCAQMSRVEVPDLEPAGLSDWRSPLYADHALVGRIWRSRSNSYVSADVLGQALLESRYVLIGEKHDNPDHHRLQRNLLEFLLASGEVDRVAMEMMDSSFDARLNGVATRQFGSLAELREYLEWDDEGWAWNFYGPLIAEVLSAGVELRSANIEGDRIQAVYAEPLEAGIATVLDSDAIEQLNSEIDASHCNMLPASQFPAMVRVQQARDHQMALRLSRPDGPDGIGLLIAGNYHIRQDLSVPNYLLALDRSVSREQILSLAILEVSPESDLPHDYLQAYSALLPYDYVWFTPAISDEDYCASLRQ